MNYLFTSQLIVNLYQFKSVSLNPLSPAEEPAHLRDVRRVSVSVHPGTLQHPPPLTQHVRARLHRKDLRLLLPRCLPQHECSGYPRKRERLECNILYVLHLAHDKLVDTVIL